MPRLIKPGRKGCGKINKNINFANSFEQNRHRLPEIR